MHSFGCDGGGDGEVKRFTTTMVAHKSHPTSCPITVFPSTGEVCVCVCVCVCLWYVCACVVCVCVCKDGSKHTCRGILV